MMHESLLEWQQAHKRLYCIEEGESNSNRIKSHNHDNWIKPKMGEIKCNIDATIFKEQGCLWNMHVHKRKPRRVHKGKKTTWFLGLPQPHEAEASGLKEAIKWFASIGRSKMFIELDCKQVVDDINRRLNTNSLFGAIIDICKTSLRTYQNFKINFIRRQTNSVVYLLTWASLSNVSSHIPSCIVTVIIDEMS